MIRKKIYTPKVVADPIYGIIDIRPVLPMIETKEFQSLADKRQLGMSYLIFPSATHTRMAHSLGAYHATRALAHRWLDLGLITEREKIALSAYALYHDIGHPAFSHVTEDLAPKDNDELGAETIKRLRKKIEACGVDFQLFEKLANHKHPLYLGVHDKNLGMEKLDYLERDGLYTILSRPAGIEYLRNHIYFINNELVINEKVVDNAIEAQNFYLKMYKNVYLRKASLIAQRMMQKIVYHLITNHDIAATDLHGLTDSELIGVMRASKEKTSKKMYGFLRERNLFREAIVFRHKNFVHNENPHKAVSVFGLEHSEMIHLIESEKLANKNQKALQSLERKIANLSGVPEDELLVAPVFNSWRFVPKDIKIYREKGDFASLKDWYPAHFNNMEETAKAYAAFRICTTEQNRKKLSDPHTAQQIYDLIMEI